MSMSVSDIDIKIIQEAGFQSAMLGLSLSHNADVKTMYDVACKLYHKDGGHNKFLESMMIWLDITAPRYWWQEADTYRMSTKQSESTMHTIVRSLSSYHIGNPSLKSVLDSIRIENFAKMYPPSDETIISLIDLASENDIQGLKALLPEGFKQRRIWCLSYKTLRNIILQRHKHRLKEWKTFCKVITENVNYPEFLTK